jgi:hypothetical protein
MHIQIKVTTRFIFRKIWFGYSLEHLTKLGGITLLPLEWTSIFGRAAYVNSYLQTPGKRFVFLEAGEQHIVSWHLLGHAIKSVICLDLQISRSTSPLTSFCIFIALHTHRGNSFKLQENKIRLKRIRLNWINSMQVKKVLFTNVFFSWSLCLLNMF